MYKLKYLALAQKDSKDINALKEAGGNPAFIMYLFLINWASGDNKVQV